MWKCKKCGEENEDSFDTCWSCEAGQDDSQTVKAKEFQAGKEESAQESAQNIHSADYSTTYSTTRMIAQFVSFVGWIVVVIGIVILITSIVNSTEPRGSFILMGLFPSFGGIISGLLLVMAGQMTRATVDTADNTGHMLVIMKKRKWK